MQRGKGRNMLHPWFFCVCQFPNASLIPIPFLESRPKLAERESKNKTKAEMVTMGQASRHMYNFYIIKNVSHSQCLVELEELQRCLLRRGRGRVSSQLLPCNIKKPFKLLLLGQH